MKKFALAASLTLASLGAAQAQEQAPVAAPTPTYVQVNPAGKPLRLFVGGGVTFGGDKLATAYYEDGKEQDLRAGAIFMLQAGVDYRISPLFSVQGSVGYHADSATASNGDMRFARIPLELLGYYHVNEKVRVGGGVRFVSNTELRSSGAGDIGDFQFEDTTSAVAELEYMVGPRVGVKVRYVNDQFKEKRFGDKVKGDHVGLLVNMYF